MQKLCRKFTEIMQNIKTIKSEINTSEGRSIKIETKTVV